MFEVQWIEDGTPVGKACSKVFSKEERAAECFQRLASYGVSDVALLRCNGVILQSYYSAAVNNARVSD